MTKISHIHESISMDTVKTLEDLLSEAKDGKLIGLAFVAVEKRRHFSIGFTGAVADDPVAAIGPAVLQLFKLAGRADEVGQRGR